MENKELIDQFKELTSTDTLDLIQSVPDTKEYEVIKTAEEHQYNCNGECGENCKCKNEDLMATNKMIDTMIKSKEDPETINAAREYVTKNNPSEEKRSKEYMVNKMKEELVPSLMQMNVSVVARVGLSFYVEASEEDEAKNKVQEILDDYKNNGGAIEEIIEWDNFASNTENCLIRSMEFSPRTADIAVVPID